VLGKQSFLLICLAVISAWAWAGEIIILQPDPATGAERNKRQAREMADTARGNVGKPVPEAYYILEGEDVGAASRSRGQADLLRREARSESSEGGAEVQDADLLILRSAPMSEANRARLKARSYVTDQSKQGQRNCTTVSNRVGMIGEGGGAQQSENAQERGGSAVNSACR